MYFRHDQNLPIKCQTKIVEFHVSHADYNTHNMIVVNPKDEINDLDEYLSEFHEIDNNSVITSIHSVDVIPSRMNRKWVDVESRDYVVVLDWHTLKVRLKFESWGVWCNIIRFNKKDHSFKITELIQGKLPILQNIFAFIKDFDEIISNPLPYDAYLE